MQVGVCRLVTISTDHVIETDEGRTAVGGRVEASLGPRRQSVEGLNIPEYATNTTQRSLATLVLEPRLHI